MIDEVLILIVGGGLLFAGMFYLDRALSKNHRLREVQSTMILGVTAAFVLVLSQGVIPSSWVIPIFITVWICDLAYFTFLPLFRDVTEKSKKKP